VTNAAPHGLIAYALQLARSGAFQSHSEIAVILSRDPGFDAVAEWFADPLIQAQLNELCANARRKRDDARRP
jgi:hypothetical protein